MKLSMIHSIFFNLFESLRLFMTYYLPHPTFFLKEAKLFFRTLLHNPYKANYQFWKEHHYGETPLTTLDKIAKEVRLQSKDVFYDLGAGRGRTLLFLSHFVKAKCFGIEMNPHFMRIGRKMEMENPQLHFMEKDFLKCSFPGATVLYLYGSCLKESEIEALTHNLARVHVGTKVVTVSFPLHSPHFTLQKVFKGTFPWGKADIYYQVKV